MTSLHDDLLELTMQRAAAHPADATALRDALWRRLQADGWTPAPHGDRAHGTLPHDSDRALLEAFAQGSPDAFDELVRRYGGRLLGYAQRSLPTAEAQDAVQDAWLVLQRKATMLLDDPSSNVRRFLFSATRFEVLDLLRRRAREKQVLEAHANQPTAEPTDALDDLLTRERAQLVAGLVDACNPLEQEVIMLALRGKTNVEIAQALGLEPNYVGVLKHRALVTLRAAIAQGASHE